MTIEGNPSSYYLPGISYSGYVAAGTLPSGQCPFRQSSRETCPALRARRMTGRPFIQVTR